ncbi:MAG: hypothetical protein Q9193_004545 [Seirophora villosa]
MSKTGRVVNVSSTGSSLSGYSKEIQDRFRSPTMTLNDLEQMMTEYQVRSLRLSLCLQYALITRQETANVGTESREGWKTQAYSVSKAAQNAMTAILARENPGLIINACCPGWIDTKMGNLMGRPPKSPAEGAKIPIRLGFKDIAGVTGRYWGNPSVRDRGEGEVREW